MKLFRSSLLIKTIHFLLEKFKTIDVQHLLTCSSLEIDYIYCYCRFHCYTTSENQKLPTIFVDLIPPTPADELARNFTFHTLTVLDFPGALKTTVTHLNCNKNMKLCGHFFLHLNAFFSCKTLNYLQSVFTNYSHGSQGNALLLYQLSAAITIHVHHSVTGNSPEIDCIYSFEL